MIDRVRPNAHETQCQQPKGGSGTGPKPTGAAQLWPGVVQETVQANGDQDESRVANVDVLALIIGKRQVRRPFAEQWMETGGNQIAHEICAEDIRKAAAATKKITFASHVRQHGR